MSKKTSSRQATIRVKRPRRQLVISGGVVLSMFAGWTLLAYSGALDPIFKQKKKPSSAVSIQSFNSNSPSKEYIYAGGRLVATEEPASSGCPPTAAPSLTTAITNSQITLTWTIPAGTAKFDVQRSENTTFNQFTNLATNLLASPPPATTMTIQDTGVGFIALSSDASNSNDIKTYVYRVVAYDECGTNPQPSNLDLGTNIVFGQAINQQQTVIQSYHLAELRVAVNAVWKAANQSPAITWANPAGINPNVIRSNTVLGDNIDQLRTKLNQALGAINPGLVAPYTDPSPIPTPGLLQIRALHFNQLRQRVKGLIPN
jgi:hypothetical protein